VLGCRCEPYLNRSVAGGQTTEAPAAEERQTASSAAVPDSEAHWAVKLESVGTEVEESQ
jgi:hypothetical protein